MPFYKRKPIDQHKHALHKELRKMQRIWPARVCRNRHWFWCKEFVRTHGLHKMDVFHRNIGKGYNYTIICDAKIGDA